MGACGCVQERAEVRGNARKSAGKHGQCRRARKHTEQRGSAQSSVQLRSHQIMAQRPNGGKAHPLQLKAAAAEQLAKCDLWIALEVVLSEIGVRHGASNLARLRGKL